MPNTQVQSFRIQGWTEGVNLEADDVTLSPTELSFGENIELGLNGEMSKRKGYTEYTTSKHASMAGGRHLFYWNQLGSANDYFIYVDADGDVHSETGTDFSSAADFDITAHSDASDYPVAGASYNNVFYLTSLRANARSFDGTSWTEITDYTLDGSGTTEFPRASFITPKHERMFAANIDNNGTRERSRIRWSNIADPTTWGSSDWIDVDPDDGSEITGMVGFADGIVIFKEKSMFFLSGVDANSFTLFPVDSTIGTASPASIAVTESAVYFLDNSRGVYKFDGAEVIRVSDKINTDLLSTQSNANRHFFRGFFYREKYYLVLHDGTALNYTWVFDLRNDSWVRWTNGFHSAAVRDGIMYVVGPVDSADTESIGIFKWRDGEADNGVVYTAKARTAWIAPTEDTGFSNQRFRIRYVDVIAAEGAGTLNVNLYEDFRTSTSTSGTVDMDNDNYDHVHRRVHFEPALQSGRTTFQLEFSLASTTQTFTIAGVDVLISPRRRQRGGNI